MKRLLLLSLLSSCLSGFAGERYNFNADWRLAIGDVTDGASAVTPDADWQQVTLPYAWNQGEAYSRNCSELSDTVMWYRKHFRLPESARGRKVFVEFEGARFGAHVFINGHDLGWADNGVMAFGFDLTPYINYKKDNVLAVYVDSDWKYREHKATINGEGKEVHSTFQWNDKNFYCNYGGINKRVWLHVTDDVYQTLPLYSNLGTKGVYVYGSDYDIGGKRVRCNVESEVVNGSGKPKEVMLHVDVTDLSGQTVASFDGAPVKVAAGDTVTLKAHRELTDVHFWSWGYGYLYTVHSSLVVNGKRGDCQSIRTGFRKTAFRDGMVYLNDRVLQLKGFAQRSTNEWPAVGISVPAWMSDYSNAQVLGCNGNFFRWMHVTPSKQDVESFDRLGLIQAMPAGDAEKDVTDRRWEQRCEVMRDAIIYNRNNPSILFYEGGNNNISDAHMAELKAIRDKYDPHGGRAAGSRNMLNSKEAEYGGEMLYVNRSAGKPMFQMEYSRDEGLRRYWDRWSYPYHKEGEGPLYRGSRAVDYNHNMDGHAVENIIRWNEYWLARPGQGKSVNSGGAKIIFSDSNTHARGEKNYRTSGDVDAMRLPKDSWFVHQAMWDGWVDTEKDHTYIIGHWNYCDTVVKPVYVCSTGDEVELLLNGKSLGKGKQSNTFLFTFDNIHWEPGTLRAVSYRKGKEVSSYEVSTVGEPVKLRLSWIDYPKQSAEGNSYAFRADGSDLRIAQVEAVDAKGHRHPLAHDMVTFSISGEGTYLGGVSGVVSDEERARNAAAQAGAEGAIAIKEGHSTDNNSIGSTQLMLEGGVIRVLVRSTLTPGDITLRASAKGYSDAVLTATTVATPVKDGFYVDGDQYPIEADWSRSLPSYLTRGETPATPSFTQHLVTVPIKHVNVPVNQEDVSKLYDDNEATDTKMYGESSKWTSDGVLDNAWLSVKLWRPAAIKQIALRMNDFRSASYPLQVYADGVLIWQGYTDKALGCSYLNIEKPVVSDSYEIRMIGPMERKEAFANMTELAAKKNVSTKASTSNRLSIIEMQFME